MLTSRRAPTAVLGIVVAATSLVACGDAGGDTADMSGEPPLAGPVEVPFGLDEVEGIEPVGRPAVYDHVSWVYRDEPITVRSVLAAYRVTGDDPPAVMRDALSGLDGLALDEGSIRGTDDRSCTDCSGPLGLWLDGSADQESPEGGGDSVHLRLWATDDGPILLVEASRLTGDAEPPRRPTIEEAPGVGGDPPSPLDAREAEAGDVLFTEQSSDIHLPPGTRTLLPTLPTWCGTGGSTSVIAAEDGEAAVRAMLDEARSRSEYGEVDGPRLTTTDGVDVVQASFTIPAGGWGFDVVGVRGPDDPYATVYVMSCAD